jgi:hypothetical protein
VLSSRGEECNGARNRQNPRRLFFFFLKDEIKELSASTQSWRVKDNYVAALSQ